MSSDHPVFTRLTRAQCVVRRRNFGYQALAFSIDAFFRDNGDTKHLDSFIERDDDNGDEFTIKANDKVELARPEHDSAQEADPSALAQGSSQRQLHVELPPSSPPAKQCKVCARWFELYWKPYLCHVCGQHICEPCSSVVEREREHNRIHFVRSCAPCLRIFNTWLPDADELAHFSFSPWVVEPPTGTSSLGLNLAEVLRSKSRWRRAGVDLLRHLGRPVGDCIDAIDRVSESDWVATTVDADDTEQVTVARHSSYGPHAALTEAALGRNFAKPTSPRILAQFLVQQCFELTINTPPPSACRFAESDGTRSYPLEYSYETGIPIVPPVPHETERMHWVNQLNLAERNIMTDTVQLACYLAGKELGCKSAVISILVNDAHFLLNMRDDDDIQTLNCATSMLTYSHVYDVPFFVRNSRLDVRFRNLPLAVDPDGVGFMVVVPLKDANGTPVAQFVVFDAKPRLFVTSTEYAVMIELANVVSNVLAAPQ